MTFIKRQFVNVSDPHNPPAGAVSVDAQFLSDLQDAVIALQTAVAGTGGGGTPTGGTGTGGGSGGGSVAVVPTSVKVTSVTATSSSVTVNWAVAQGTDGVVLSGVIVCRDGYDSLGTGPYCSTSQPPSGSLTFDKLAASTIYNLSLQPLVNGQPSGPKVTTTGTTSAPAGGATVYVTDTFTGTDGSPWDTNKWVSTQTPSSGGTQIVGNVGKVTTGPAGAYAAGDAVSRALNMTSQQDIELLIDFQVVTEVYPRFFLRSTDNADPAHYSYTVEFSSTGGNLVLNQISNYTVTTLATSAIAPGNAWYTLRFRTIGSTIAARAWPQGTTEPTTWNIGSFTSNSVDAAGFAGFRMGGGNAGGQVVNVDNVTVTNGGGTVAPAPSPAPAPTTGTTFLSGAVLDAVDPISPTAGPLYTWRGGTRPIGITNTWSDDKIQTQISQWSMTYSQYVPYSWTGQLDLGFGGIFLNEGDTWANAAAGAYESRWDQGLTNIKNNRGSKAQTYIRPFHEFNGDWYQWKVTPAITAQFIQTWQRWAARCRAIFPAAKIVWCPNRETAGGSGIKSTDAYPGDAYVDVIGPDYYFHYPPAFTQADWDSQLNATDGYGGPKGIGAWRSFALSRSKPICIPEFGIDSDPTGGAGGDQPLAMTNFLNYVEANQGTGAGQFLYVSLFNAATPTDAYQGKFGVYNGTVSAKQPNSAAAYQAWHQAR